MNRRLHTLLLFVWCALVASAQNISVSSFKLLENDLTANTAGTMERDQNGEVAALIKVVTTEQGFVFDGGMTGIVKTKQEVGEVWVYVPYGIKKITIKHPQLGVLRDYYFPIAIDKAKTYEMVLTTGKVEVVVSHTMNKQFVVFNVTPADAVVELGDEVLTVDGEGYATKSMPFGTYDYRVSCANYHTTAGKVTVNAQGKAEVNVTLRPNFGWIKFTGDSEYHGAHIYIDNERVGQLPLTTGKLKSGEHRIKVVKEKYKTFERGVSVSDDLTTEVNVQLVPNFATVTLVADEHSEIWVDGARKGVGRWTGPLELGEYVVEAKKESHRPTSEVVKIPSVGERTIQLQSPTPIYGSLEISSNPLRAKVYIDDEEVGETPLILSNVLVGNRRISLKKEGYGSVTKNITVIESEENQLNIDLSKTASSSNTTPSAGKTYRVALTSNPSGAEVWIDGKLKGKTPLEVILTSGNHHIQMKKDGYLSVVSAKNIVTSDVVHMNLVKIEKDMEWGYMCGLDAGYSNYGLNYGGELGVALNKFSLSVGVKSHVMGSYEYRHDMMNDFHKTKKVRLLRFSTKLGYTFGDRWQFTPQVGVLFGPSYFTGRKYITREILTYEEMCEADMPGNYYLLEGADYTEMNRNIMSFARTRLAIVLGARMGVNLSRNGRWGIYVNPEYIINEGINVNAGLMMKF